MHCHSRRSGAVHVASDSRVFTRKAQQIIDRPAAWPCKPWSITIDGDLWEAFHGIVIQKGSHAVRVSWTNGHIIEQQVHAGEYTREAKECNDIADKLADKGVSQHPGIHCAMAEVWAARQQSYAAFLCDVHAFICDMLRADADKRDRLQRVQAFCRQPSSKQRIPAVGALPHASSGRKLRFFSYSPLAGKSHLATSRLGPAILEFLRELEIVEAPENSNGISWVELLFLFEMQGGVKWFEHSTPGLRKQATPPMRLRDFKQAVRHVVSRCSALPLLMPPHAASLALASKTGCPLSASSSCSTILPPPLSSLVSLQLASSRRSSLWTD